VDETKAQGNGAITTRDEQGIGEDLAKARREGLSAPRDEVRRRHQVVVIGSGFGGLFTTQALRRADVDVTLIAKTSHHLFQPLLYQVATGILSEGEIAPSTREILGRQRNATVLLGEVSDIDIAGHTITSTVLDQTRVTPYDSLVVAAGSGQSYFGHDEFARFAPGMKSIDDALELRGRIFGSFEMAELVEDEEQRARLMTFVVVGAGPTGVEMAGQIAELAHRTLRHEFRRIDPRQATVILLDAAPSVLGTFGDHLGAKAMAKLDRIGVEVQLGAKVVGVDGTGIEVEDAGGRRRIESVCKVWAAGVSASPLGRQLAEQSGAGLDRAGRVEVEPDLTLPGHPEVFALGDMVRVSDGAGGQIPLPGVAPAAMQQGRYAAKVVRARLAGQPPPAPFRYVDKGNLATIGRMKAVGEIKGLHLSGTTAWLGWLFVHLLYLTGLQNRILVFVRWTVSFLTRGRGARLITGGADEPEGLSAEAPPTG